MNDVPAEFPGAELVQAGLDDLAASRESEASLLVSMAAPRLRALGFDVPAGTAQPSHRLYELLASRRMARTAVTARSSVEPSVSPGRPSMRPPVDEPRIRALASELSLVARGTVRIYLTGGATAVLEAGVPRRSTLRFEPEADELLRALPELKNRLGINIELASPPDLIPELPGWWERSPLVFQEGRVAVHHFDPYSQTLSKIERGFEQDLADVHMMITRGLVDPARLREFYEAIEPEFYRYPAIEPPAFRREVDRELAVLPT